MSKTIGKEEYDGMASRIALPVRMFVMCHDLKSSSLRLNVLEDLTSGETRNLLHDLSVMLDRISDEIEKE